MSSCDQSTQRHQRRSVIEVVPVTFYKESETNFGVVCRSEYQHSKITPFYAIAVSYGPEDERFTLRKYKGFYQQNLNNIPLALAQPKFPQPIVLENVRDMLKFNEYIATKDRNDLIYTLGKRYNTLPTLEQVVLYFNQKSPFLTGKRKIREEERLIEMMKELFRAFQAEFDTLQEIRKKEYQHAYDFIQKQTHQLNVLQKRDKRYRQKVQDSEEKESKIHQRLLDSFSTKEVVVQNKITTEEEAAAVQELPLQKHTTVMSYSSPTHLF